MMLRYKFLFSAIMLGVSGPALIPNAQAAALNIYAGPQSVTPRETIYVTVQSADNQAPIELTYMSDGVYKILRGVTEHGLTSFEVPAQKRAGHMRFTATSRNALSNPALVSVLAGPPKRFTLSIKRAKQAGSVTLISDIIQDKFGNPMSDLALARLDWADQTGLIASQNIQLSQGRLVLTAKCPGTFKGTLRLRAVVNDAEYVTPDMSWLCSHTTSLKGR